MIFKSIQTYTEIFKSALVYINVGATRTLIMISNIKICGTNGKESIGIGATHIKVISREDRKSLKMMDKNSRKIGTHC